MLFSGSRQLRLAGILSALALVGCGSGPKHNPPGGTGGTGGTGGNGYGTFAWGVYDIEDYPSYTTPLSCAVVGAASVVVTLTNQANPSITRQASASCGDFQMSTSDDVPVGDYTAGFDLIGDPAIYGNAPPLLDSFDATGTFHIAPGANDFRSEFAPFLAQSFTVAWGIYVSSVLSSCAAVGATYVDLDFAVGSSSAWVTSRFACATGEGASYAIPYGETTAQWRLYLVDAAGNEIPTTVPGGTVTPLPTTTNVGLGTQIFSF